MKAVLMSIKPKWCEKIFSGEKTVEVRKTAPKLEPPFKVYVYCTKQGRPLVWGAPCAYYADERLTQTFGYSFEEADKIFGALNGKVVGEFVCDKVKEFTFSNYEAEYRINHTNLSATCLNYPDLIEYGKGKTLCGWHITEPKLYDTPKELREFYKHDNTYDNAFGWVFEDRPKKVPIKRPPQSWCYIEEI